jgi:exopolysaccharide production protein ExoZ
VVLKGTGRDRLSSLDSCRGIAILMVIAFHVSVTYRPAPWLGRLAVIGNLGVQLFFLVSAVTMCLMWDQRREESQRTLKFYIRRFLRIAPLFWFAMVFYTLIWHVSPDGGGLQGITWFQVAVTSIFLHTLFPSATNSVVPGGWSIGIEMGFYLVFPLLALVPKNRLVLFSFAAYVILGLLGTAVAERFGSGDDYAIFLYYSFLTQLPIFPIGMFVYGVTHGEVTLNRVYIGAWVILWLVIAIVAKLALHWTSRPLFWFEVMLLAAVVGSSIRWNLATKWLAYIGRLSYSMYLFHFAVLYFLERLFGNGWSYSLGMAATLAITIVIAAVSQSTAERWSQELARYLIASLKGNPVAIAQA